MTRPAIRPTTPSILKMVAILDEHPDAEDRDYDLINRLQSAVYFHGRDAAGLEIPSPPERQWKVIHGVLNGDCYGHPTVNSIRKLVDDYYNDPEVRWALQPGDKVVQLMHMPPIAPRGDVLEVVSCEHVPRSERRHGEFTRITKPVDIANLKSADGREIKVNVDFLAPLVADDPTGYIIRAYDYAWKLSDLVPDNDLFAGLRKEILGLKSELLAAVGANAHFMRTEPDE